MVGQAEVQQGTRASGLRGVGLEQGALPLPHLLLHHGVDPLWGPYPWAINCGLQRVKEMIFRSHILGFEKHEDNLKTIGCFEKTKNEVLLLRA